MEPYPRSNFDRPGQMLKYMGSFWSSMYAGRAQMRAYAGAVGAAGNAAVDDQRERVDCLARSTIPVWHEEPWTLLRLLESDVVDPSEVPTYGSDAAGTYGGGLEYGEAVAVVGYGAALPVVDVAVITNRIYAPTRTLIAGLDFSISGGRVYFRDNPFADPEWARRPVSSADGSVADVELAVWLCRSKVDRRYVYNHAGYILGLDLPSSQSYKDTAASMLDAVVGGPNGLSIGRALSAMTGVPLASSDGEAVEAVFSDGRGPAVITDAAAYRLPPGSKAVVAVGDVLAAGDPLCDAFEVVETNRGVVPPGLTRLAIGRGILPPDYLSDIVFEDVDTPLVVTRDPKGRTKVSFAVGGFPADVDKFWDDVHARGVASGKTLAQMLDIREDPDGQPSAASLPATVNPLQFLLANLLRSNCCIVRIRVGSIAADAAGISPMRLLRRLMPPQVAVITLLELPPFHDDGPPASSETLGTFTALEPLADSVEAGASWDGPIELRYDRRICF